jgi:hypothetical protein
MLKIKNKIESLPKEEIINITKNIDILEEIPETEPIIKTEEKKEEPPTKPKKE